MLHLLREHLIGARFAYTVYETTITNTQASLLSELACRETPSIEELCEVLKVHASTISRTIEQLRAKGMVSSRRSRVDRRRVLHVCSKKGLAFAEFTWRKRKEIIDQRLASFSKKDQRQLETFLRVFVGDAAFSRVIPVKDEALLATIFRALTYDHGIASGNFLGSGFSSSDWLLLSEIHYNKRSPGELSKLMGAGKATLSLRLKSLATRGLITSHKDSRDKRARIILLTERGQRALQAIESLAESSFNRALEPIQDVTELQHGMALFKRYVFSLKRSQILTARVEQIAQEDLPAIRSSALSAIARYGPAYPSSGYLLHRDNFIARIVTCGAPPLIIECSGFDDSRPELANLVCLDQESFPLCSSEICLVIMNTLGKTLMISETWRNFIDGSTATPTTSG